MSYYRRLRRKFLREHENDPKQIVINNEGHVVVYNPDEHDLNTTIDVVRSLMINEGITKLDYAGRKWGLIDGFVCFS